MIYAVMRGFKLNYLMNRYKLIVSKVQDEDDFDISALASIIKNCSIFMSDTKYQHDWNDCNLILKECRNELNHAAIQKSCSTEFQNFLDVKENSEKWLKEISDAFDPDCDEMRYFISLSYYSIS